MSADIANIASIAAASMESSEVNFHQVAVD
jgi:hypothetical protein